MIRARGKVTGFGITRWAIDMVAERQLRPLEGHVLLLLACHAKIDDPAHPDFCRAWPSVETLARQCGLKVVRKGDGAGRNSSISAALARLEELQLIWSTQSGNGRTARRELLYLGAPESASQVRDAVRESLESAPVHRLDDLRRRRGA